MSKMKRFEVSMKCEVYKSVTVECKTEEQARNDPWDYAVDEIETDQIDWEVLSVKEDRDFVAKDDEYIRCKKCLCVWKISTANCPNCGEALS